jgi:hypothetical protein
LLEECSTYALDDPSADLLVYQEWIDDCAAVFNDPVAQQLYISCFRIDFDIAGLYSVGTDSVVSSL